MVLVGLIMGFGIIWIHIELQKHYPEKNITEINTGLFGKISLNFIPPYDLFSTKGEVFLPSIIGFPVYICRL